MLIKISGVTPDNKRFIAHQLTVVCYISNFDALFYVNRAIDKGHAIIPHLATQDQLDALKKQNIAAEWFKEDSKSRWLV